MRNYEMLNRIYKAYNGEDVTIQEMYMNAKRYTDTVLQCYSYHLDEGISINILRYSVPGLQPQMENQIAKNMNSLFVSLV